MPRHLPRAVPFQVGPEAALKFGMSREISLSGGDVSVLKALGLSGGTVGGKALMDRLGGMEAVEIVDALDSLMMLDYVLCDLPAIKGPDDLKHANFNVNTAMLRDLREALAPQKKENKPKRQRRG